MANVPVKAYGEIGVALGLIEGAATRIAEETENPKIKRDVATIHAAKERIFKILMEAAKYYQ